MKRYWMDNLQTVVAFLSNFLLVYATFMICRLAYYLENYGYFRELSFGHLLRLCAIGIYFDTSAILYTNILFILLFLFPFHWKESPTYHRIVRLLFVVTNMLAVVVNLMDAVYFPYTNRRTTASVFSQFSHETNLGRIFGIELLQHWYLVLLALALGYGLYRLYRRPTVTGHTYLPVYYIVMLPTFLLSIPLAVAGMRGGMTRATRPITLSNANQYVDRPIETALVLNTPFAIYRTLGKKPFVVPGYFTDRRLMQSLYSPVHKPSDSMAQRRMNVVVLILESFGREYYGAFNKDLERGHYKGYTPFLDSLIRHSMVCEYSFCNGRQSIDGMPSVLSGIPRFVEPFFLTTAALNNLTGIAGELGKEGYYTAFFHGASNGSMGFEAYAKASGFHDYFGRTEYDNDKDFDGNWAIWDEPFLQFYARKMTGFQQPFMTSVFTASSHHPYNIPDQYKELFKGGDNPMYRCIQYSDYALKRFFETASRQPWFANTLFVITGDHTNVTSHDEYKTAVGLYAVPVIFYTPDNSLAGRRNCISQQIDIMPSVLGYLGYNRPYVSFGCDLFHTPDAQTFAVNYMDGIYQYFKGDYLLQFDGERTVAVYAFKTDRLLRQNLVGRISGQKQMEDELKSIIQQYMERMTQNKLVIEQK